MRPPQKYLDAFAKLLAPPPRILVFVDLPGLQWAATEMPDTFQVIVGLSLELFRHIENEQFNTTGKHLHHALQVEMVSGSNVRIPILDLVQSPVVPDDPSASCMHTHSISPTPIPDSSLIVRAEDTRRFIP